MFAPPKPAAAAEHLFKFRKVAKERLQHVIGAVHEHRAVFISHRQRLLIRQRECFGGRVVGHIPARRLIHQPFARASCIRARLRGHLLRRQRSGAGHRLVQAESFAKDKQRHTECRPKIANRPPHEFLQSCFVDGHAHLALVEHPQTTDESYCTSPGQWTARRR